MTTDTGVDRTFDRKVSYDDRSLGYGIRTLLGAVPARSYSWRYVQLDQGPDGACTGFSATMEAAARPKPVFGDPVRKEFAESDVASLNTVGRQVYREAQKIDEWPGESYEGSSVLAAAKVGRARGWWGEYRWALGPGAAAAADDVMRTVGRFGPVMMGSWWYAGMMDAGADGFLRVAGSRLGGHAYLLTAYNARRDAVWTPNSWGGQGQGWLTRADLTRLLGEDGEACVAVNRKLVVPTTA
jgi:hypothetical protein